MDFGMYIQLQLLLRRRNNPWAFCDEKSAAAKRCERQANGAFDTIRRKFERTEQANKEAIVRLGCKPESESMFKNVPEITLVHILQYARPKNYLSGRENEASRRNVAAAAASSNGRVHSHPFHFISNAEADGKEMAAAAMGLSASSAAAATSSSPAARSPSSKRNNKVLYNNNAGDEDVEKMTAAKASLSGPSSERLAFGSPGKKHTFHLLNPNVHLTGPCWRDFGRYVRSFDGWNVKRIQATPGERKKYRFTKKGKAYFIKVIHTNPGTASKPKKKAANKRTAVVNQDTAIAKNEPVIDCKPPAKKKAKKTA